MLQSNYSLIPSLNMLFVSQTLWQALRIYSECFCPYDRIVYQKTRH